MPTHTLASALSREPDDLAFLVSSALRGALLEQLDASGDLVPLPPQCRFAIDLTTLPGLESRCDGVPAVLGWISAGHLVFVPLACVPQAGQEILPRENRVLGFVLHRRGKDLHAAPSLLITAVSCMVPPTVEDIAPNHSLARHFRSLLAEQPAHAGG
jgi:hypothetical protein